MHSGNLGNLSAEFRKFLLYNHPQIKSTETVGVPFQKTAREAMAKSNYFLMNNHQVKDFIKKIVQLIGFDASLGACIEYAAQQETIKETLDKDDPVALGNFYNQVVLPCMQTRSKMLEKIVLLHSDLNETERLLMLIGSNIGLAFDAIFAKWWKWVIVPHRLGLKENDKLKDLIKNSSFQDHYSVLVNYDGSFIEEPLTEKLLKLCREKPLALAFPEDIKFIQDNLLYLLENLPRDEKAYQEYFRTLYYALGNTDITAMKNLWTKVDIAWIKISSDKRVIPVHMMEWRYHHPIQISPEFRVLFRTTDDQDKIALMREAMKQYSDTIDDAAAKKKLDFIDIGIFLTIVNGGQGIDFRIAGQSVPNTAEVRSLGMKIFIDPESMTKRLARMINLLKSCLSEETLSWVLPALEPAIQTYEILGHEYAHPFLVDEKLNDVFGSEKSEIEETKATFFGNFGIKNAIQRGRLDQSTYSKLSAYQLADTVRRFEKTQFKDPTLRPYVNTAKTLVTIFMSQGMLTIQGGKLHMPKEVAESDQVINALTEITERIIQVYKKVNLDDALQIVAEFAPGLEDNNIKTVYHAVNG